MFVSMWVQAADIGREIRPDGVDLIFADNTFADEYDAAFRQLTVASVRAIVIFDAVLGGGGRIPTDESLGTTADAIPCTTFTD